MANNYRLPTTPSGDAGIGPNMATTDNGVAHEQWVRIAGGANPTGVSTGLAAVGTVGGATDYSSVGNISVSVFGTYGGAALPVLNFEGSPDGGTTWLPLAGQQESSGAVEMITQPLPANTIRSWAFSFYGLNRFRVRVTNWTTPTGTMTVRIDPGAQAFEPVVSAVLSKPATQVPTNFSTVVGGVTGVTAEALISLIPTRGAVAGGAATAQTVTAGKTFKATALSIAISNSAATQNGVRVFLRALPSTPVLVTSPIMAMVGISAPNAVSGGMTGAVLPLDIDFPSGWGFGLTQIAAIASGSVYAHLMGYEF